LPAFNISPWTSANSKSSKSFIDLDISNFATSGLYGFSNSKLYLNYYSGEVYISEVYKKMINDGLRITSDKIHEDKNTLVVGTPTEYLTLSNILS
jgi:dTDP-glucose pyrophosphorylase